MKKVYETTDDSRANEILRVLHNEGISASIHGKYGHSLGYYVTGSVLTVWVNLNKDIRKAHRALEKYYEAERRALGVSRPGRMSAQARRFWLVLLATAIGVALGALLLEL